MKGVLATIPMNFPNRLEYCTNIIMCIEGLQSRSETEVREILPIMDSLPIIVTSVEKLLLKASNKLQQPLCFFLVPSVDECIVEGCSGHPYGRKDEVTEVTLFTLNGPVAGKKAVLACNKCGTRYGIDSYRPRGGKSRVYPSHLQVPVVQASNKVYFSEDTFELMCESANHGFVSSQAFAQIYQTVFNRNHTAVKDFLFGTLDASLNPFMTRKNASEAFFNGEVDREIRRLGMESLLTFKNDSSREDVMKKIDDLRKTELYPHPPEDCNEVCQKRGCKNLRVIDACWKLCIPHCMLAVPTEVQGSPLLSFPNVCTEEPMPGSVFCFTHHSILVDKGIPTEKKEFLKYIGCKENPSSQEDIKRVDEKVIAFMADLAKRDSSVRMSGTSAAQYQGTASIVDQMPADILNDSVKVHQCNKDTGEKGRLRQRARGHFAAVSGGGNILCFNPIYKSESPSQIFMLTIQMIYNEMKNVPEDELESRLGNYILAYDNMCNLNKIRAASEELPLPGHLKNLWKLIRKIIDRLHMKNHKEKECHITYNPERVLQNEEKDYNTMAAEQLFAWMSRFKKIVNSMTQTHHLFYIHRMCLRRNSYSALCRKRGIEPVHPGVNIKLI